MPTSSNPLSEQYPWLFLDRSYTIDIIYDLTEPNQETDERELSAGLDTMETATAIQKALQSTGHIAQLVPVTHDNYQNRISKLTGEIIFNQVEEDELGLKVLSLIEKLNKPVTGVGSTGWLLSWNKLKIKEILTQAQIPTPQYFTVSPKDGLSNIDLPYPLFVKAANDHGSLSVNEKSVVNNLEELVNQVQWITKNIGGPALIEEYIDGRELQVTVLGNGNQLLVLPIKEIIFGPKYENKPKIVTYQAKWKTKSPEYLGTSKMECPANLTDLEQKAIENAVESSCQILNVRGYARFDIRLKNNTPYIIDYNANPAIGPNDASTLPVKVLGLNYQEFITAILAVALKRYQ